MDNPNQLSFNFPPMKAKKINNIGIIGNKGHGKDTLADLLADNLEWDKESLATPIKEIIHDLLNDIYSTGIINGVDRKSFHDFYKYSKEDSLPGLPNITLRNLYQTFGTEWAQNHLFKDVWVLLATHWNGKLLDQQIISDVRFLHEAQALLGLDYLLIRVERPDVEANKFSNHSSETQVNSLPYHIFVYNDSDLAALQRAADHIVTLLQKPLDLTHLLDKPICLKASDYNDPQ